MMFTLGKNTLANIEGCHPDLVELCHRVIRVTTVDFCVVAGGGLRTKAQARLNVKNGTGVLKSRHLTGDAIDFVVYKDGKPNWSDLGAYRELMEHVYREADDMGLLFIHGADWNADGTFGNSPKEWDWPHIQRPYYYQEEKALTAQQRRILSRAEEEAPDTERGLSRDITPGLTPEDMNDEEFEP